MQLDLLLPFQRNDFQGIFEALGSRPATVRLIDPPLHEFLPSMDSLIAEVATLKVTHPDSPGPGRQGPTCCTRSRGCTRSTP